MNICIINNPPSRHLMKDSLLLQLQLHLNQQKVEEALVNLEAYEAMLLKDYRNMHNKTDTSDATGSTLSVSNFQLSCKSSLIELALELCVLCGEQEKILATQEIYSKIIPKITSDQSVYATKRISWITIST